MADRNGIRSAAGRRAAPARREAGTRRPSADGAPRISVVAPVFNEDGNVDELHRRLTRVLAELGEPYEIVLVDDGSTDGSFERLDRIHARDAHVRVIRLSRNFGHHIAITAGLDAARGELVVMMDADLQDLPEEIPRLYARLQEGFDVVYGIRTEKKHSRAKRLASWGFFGLMRRALAQFEMSAGIFRIARRPVVDAVRECRETHRFVIGLMSWAGFRQTGLEVRHGERHSGETKYPLSKQLRLALTTVVSFTALPLQLTTYLGLAVAASSFAYGIVIVLRKVVWDLGELGWPSMMLAILFLGGVQLVALGVLGEYVRRTLTESQARPLYVVAETLETPAAAASLPLTEAG